MSPSRWTTASPTSGWLAVAVLAACCCLHLAAAATAMQGGDREGSCPPLQPNAACAAQGVAQASCARDADCARAADKCCPSACGHACVKPLYTGCELLRRESLRRARALSPALGANVTVPRCRALDGAFERVQCAANGRAPCWCVDQSGAELPGTRATSRDQVDCDGRSRCSRPTCRMLCPNGFALDADGCARCSCRDPCADVACPAGAVCSSAPAKCRDPPCPAIASCKAPRALHSACPHGAPLAVQGSQRPFLCGVGPGRPACPPLFSCAVQPRHEYGVCCPAGRSAAKPGACPAPRDARAEDAGEDSCREECDVDLECPHMQKCCRSDGCGMQCVQPRNVTECLVARALSELLAGSEREGRGYAPQCEDDGDFARRQCSRNGLVCWCVDPSTGHKSPGSMGSASTVHCPSGSGRSLTRSGPAAGDCDRQLCAQLCQYGFANDERGCPTCECAHPCAGFECPRGQRCAADGDEDCQGTLCTVTPQCVADPELAEASAPKAEAMEPVGEAESIEPNQEAEPMETADEAEAMDSVESASSVSDTEETENDDNGSMCRYLRDFDATMEGTRSDMKLALPPPQCTADGAFQPKQCAGGECWCADEFGTEIPQSRGNATDCLGLRRALDCREPQCRLACEYGFVLDAETRCATCACRDACDAVRCDEGSACVAVDVSCPRGVCAPVPVCLPVKEGQCPYLVPGADGSCEFECGADAACPGAAKCCPNGCGTSCVEPLRLTACQHRRAQMKHAAADQGVRGAHLALPRCRAEDGAYERVQCAGNGAACWCVDQSGAEIGGTRRRHGQTPDCDAPSKCPPHRCPSPADCPHGFARDPSGCETCVCVDPCAGHRCPPHERCRLAGIACVGSGPCPPTPVCVPREEARCEGQPPLAKNDSLVRCGPGSQEQCPSSHRCLLSPLGEPAVCCPKPRSVCVEPQEPRDCAGSAESRWRFNASANRCELAPFCGGAVQNAFGTENECHAVCPVLSQCERVRQRNALRPNALSPACDARTGAWAPTQCLPAAGVCWCVTPDGRPRKGSVSRGEPTCNFRTARRRNDDVQELDVLERLLGQLTQWQEPSEPEANLLADAARSLDAAPADEDLLPPPPPAPLSSRCLAMRAKMTAAAGAGGGGYVVACDPEGRFTPVQCYQHRPECWCVDEAGNQLPESTTFLRGDTICLPTPIEAVEVRLGFASRSPLRPPSSRQLAAQVRALLARLGAKLRDDAVAVQPAGAASDGVVVEFALVGGNKVDVAYRLEEMVISESVTLPVSSWEALTADVTASRFTHRLADAARAASVIARDQREVVMETAPTASRYQAAILVLSVASATVICVLVLLVMLYRRKVAQASAFDRRKLSAPDQRFVDAGAPIYVVSLPGPTAAQSPQTQPINEPGLRL